MLNINLKVPTKAAAAPVAAAFGGSSGGELTALPPPPGGVRLAPPPSAATAAAPAQPAAPASVWGDFAEFQSAPPASSSSYVVVLSDGRRVYSHPLDGAPSTLLAGPSNSTNASDFSGWTTF